MSIWRPLAGRLGAEVAGPDGARRVVFLHGFTQTANSWKPIAEHFVNAGHECMVIDLPGHAGSTNVRADLRRAADMIAAIGGKATYVGYSLGGRAALHVGNIGGDHLRALRGLLDVAGNLLRRRALLFHGGRDRRVARVDLGVERARVGRRHGLAVGRRRRCVFGLRSVRRRRL